MRAVVLASCAVVLASCLAACSAPTEIALDYELASTIMPSDVVRVETVVSVDPSDPRKFFAEQPYREVAPGVGYEVRDLDGSGVLKLLVTQDATIGFTFTPAFTFTLLPPSGEAAPPLDLVAVAHSATDRIGGTMMLMAKFGGGTHVKVPITDDRCGSAACKNNRVCCSQACVDPLTDASNCGKCGDKCSAGETCAGGVCQCAGGSGCASSQTCCSAGCVDLMNDAFNCGSCGHACNAGETCTSGTCKCGTNPACTGGESCCSGACVAGGCLCGVVHCSQQDSCCSSSCVDESTDNLNCGKCNNACTGNLTCSNGACACKGVRCVTGDMCCSTGCANVTNDPDNCGACNHNCRPGEQCTSSQCTCGMMSCSATQTCCGATCVDVQTDVANCGACGHACLPGETCAKGVCSCDGGGACTSSETCCAQGPNGSPGGCFDLANDPFHCGSCTNACPTGQACMMGKCVQSQCQPACTNGNVCIGGTCSCGGPACAPPTTCCLGNGGMTGGGCFNLLTDVDNCGGCGKKCNFGDYCCNGNCTSPDKNNCGGCNTMCNALQTCCVCPTTASCIGLTQKCLCPLPPNN